MIVQARAAQDAGARASSMVRFGNVLGQRARVVPLFRSRSRAGGPVTVTHPEMIALLHDRSPRRRSSCCRPARMAAGGEVFVLDMGEPVRSWTWHGR